MNTRMTAVLTDVKSTVLDLKPYAHIDKLISTVLPFTERHILAKGEIIQYHNNDVRLCFLLLHGSVALHRRGDGIVLNSESSPFILGVSSQFSSEHLYVRALETSEIAHVSLDNFNKIVAEKTYGNIFQSYSSIPPPGYTSTARKYRRCQPMTLSGFSWSN